MGGEKRARLRKIERKRVGDSGRLSERNSHLQKLATISALMKVMPDSSLRGQAASEEAEGLGYGKNEQSLRIGDIAERTTPITF